MIIRPMADRVLVRPDSQERITESGLWIPDAAEEYERTIGEVLMVGPPRFEFGVEYPLPELQPGDRVFYSKYGGAELKVGGERFVLLYTKDIWAVVNP